MVEISYHSGIHTLKAKQALKIGKSEAWAFLSNPSNLNVITPEDVRFRISSLTEPRMYPGQVITYQVTIFGFMKFNWVTEITHIVEEMLFVDEQRFGPYRFWHHKHFIEEVDGELIMTDVVSYKVCWGPLDKLFNSLFVKCKLKRIFEYRERKLNELFNT